MGLAPEVSTCEASILEDLGTLTNERRAVGRWTPDMLGRWTTLLAELLELRREIRDGIRASGIR